jgi:TonB family protein
MNWISVRAPVLVAAALLAVCSPIAHGQAYRQRASKLQAENALQILSPTEGADFCGYTRHLMATLKRKWIYVMPESFYEGDTGIVDIRVQVRADGTFSMPDPKVEKSSGKDALDAAAVATVRASAPFPHFPSAFEGATIELRISFFYNIPVTPYPVLAPAKPDACGEPPK